jgi:UDP-N-acetylglucosamine 2-epimerase (non-hydrolysing)
VLRADGDEPGAARVGGHRGRSGRRHRQHRLERDGFVLSTFHRPENVDDVDRLRRILAELATFPVPVLLPLHPRTAARLADSGGNAGDPIRVVEPIGYREFLGLAAACAFLVSDSGGVQEEASIVKRPVLVVRASTERPEVLGTFAELGDPATIGPIGRDWMGDLVAVHARLAGLPSPYGDGTAGTRTADAIHTLAG